MAERLAQQVTPATTRPPTVDELMAILARQRAEVVNGEIVLMSPPELKHSWVSRTLFRSLDQHVVERQLGEVFFETTYVLAADARTDWVRGSKLPDVSFVPPEKLRAHLDQHGDAGPLRLVPDLAVEVVSPNDSFTDVNQKIADYLRYGVKLVWIVDPQDRTIRVYTPDDPGGVTLYEDDTLSGAPVLPDWALAVSEILGQPGS